MGTKSLFGTVPREFYTKEMMHVPHKIDIGEVGKGRFKFFFDPWVARKINEVVYIDANVERWTVWENTAVEDAWCILTRMKLHGGKNIFEFIVPVTRGTAKPIKRFVEFPEVGWIGFSASF